MAKARLLRRLCGGMANTEAESTARIASSPPARYNGMAKFGRLRRSQFRVTVSPLRLPKSINATTSSALLLFDPLTCISTAPSLHLMVRHMSESLKATWFWELSAVPCAETFMVESVVQSDRPETRMYLLPAIHPATSRAEPMAMHTLDFLSRDLAEILTRLSTSCSTFGSVTTYSEPFTGAAAVISLSGFQTVEFNTPNTTHAMASKPKIGVTMPRMIFACRVGPVSICGFSCSSCNTVIAFPFYSVRLHKPEKNMKIMLCRYGWPYA